MSALSAKIPFANPFSDETVMLPMMFSFWPDFVMEFAKIPVVFQPPEPPNYLTDVFEVSGCGKQGYLCLARRLCLLRCR